MWGGEGWGGGGGEFVFFFNDTATTEIYTLSLHDALPILHVLGWALARNGICVLGRGFGVAACEHPAGGDKERQE